MFVLGLLPFIAVWAVFIAIGEWLLAQAYYCEGACLFSQLLMPGRGATPYGVYLSIAERHLANCSLVWAAVLGAGVAVKASVSRINAQKAASLLVNVMLCVITTVIVFGLGLVGVEAYMWKRSKAHSEWHDPNTRFDPENGWVPIESRQIYEEGKLISSNSLGFRSPEIDPQRRTIAVIGDSVAWGFGVGDSQVFSAHFDSIVRPQGYQVQNLAVSGYGIDQTYLLLNDRLDSLPHLWGIILVIFTGNDLIDTQSNTVWGKRKPLFEVRNRVLELTEVPISQYCLQNLLSVSYTVNLISRSFPQFKEFLETLTEGKKVAVEDAEYVLSTLLGNIKTMAEKRSARFLVVLSPLRSGDLGSDENHVFFQNLMRKLGLEYVDFAEELKTQRYALDELYLPKDRAHFTELGHRLLADAVTAKLFK